MWSANRNRGLGLFVAALIFVTPFTPRSADAQINTQTEQLQRLQEQLQRQEQEKRRAEELERRRRELTPPEPEPEPEAPPLPEGEQCADVTAIRLEGVTVLSEEAVESMTASYRDRCLTIADIQALLNAINQSYHARGYVTSRAFLPAQDLQDGGLVLSVLEGTVEVLSLEDEDGGDGGELYFAFPIEVGDLLNLRDIEQGLDQMNRLASNNAAMEIVPGTEPGASRIAVTNQIGDRFRFEFGRDNSGSRSTGLQQNLASFGVDNVLGFNDSWRVSYNRSALNHADEQRSQSGAISLSLPLGYWTLSYSGSYHDYGSLVLADVQDFFISGVSRSHVVGLSRVIHRDQTSKTRLDVGLRIKDSRNFVEDVLVEVSSRRLSVGNLDLSHSRRQWGGISLLTFGHERGLTWFDALKDDPDQDSEAPKAQFRKWTFSGSYRRPFDVWSESLVWTAETRAMYSPDTLYGTERFGLGGSYSVRGFRDETLSGDRGFYLRNEIGWSLVKADFWGDPVLKEVIGEITPYIAYDWGRVGGGTAETLERGALSGMTVGLRNSAGRLMFEFAYSRALSAPALLEEKGEEVSFKVAFKF